MIGVQVDARCTECGDEHAVLCGEVKKRFEAQCSCTDVELTEHVLVEDDGGDDA